MGVATALLTIWDAHNSYVIESMGMAWDIGAPIWPYQTSDILLRFLNYPAYFFAVPITNFFRLAAPKHHLIVLPAAFAWWWFVGLKFDHGLVKGRTRWRRPISTLLFVLAAVLLCVAIGVSVNAFRWWSHYGGRVWNANPLLMLRFLTPAVWSYALAFVVAVAGKKVVSEQLS